MTLHLKATALIVAAGVLLSACSITLPVRGQVGDAGEIFMGTATGYSDGAGNMAVVSSLGTRCTGAFVYVTRREGRGTFICEDGRSGPFDFATTGRRGTGTGVLGGQRVTFTFGSI